MATKAPSSKAAPRKAAPRKAAPRKAAPRKRELDNTERVSKSLDAVQKLLEDMRGDLDKGARALVTDAEKAIRSARRDIKKLGTSLRRDISAFEKNAGRKKNAGRS